MEDPHEKQHVGSSLIFAIYFTLCGRFGEDSVEVADSSFVVASGYITDNDNGHKAKKYLEDAITLYMKHKGPYHNSTIKAQVCLPELYSIIIETLTLVSCHQCLLLQGIERAFKLLNRSVKNPRKTQFVFGIYR